MKIVNKAGSAGPDVQEKEDKGEPPQTALKVPGSPDLSAQGPPPHGRALPSLPHLEQGPMGSFRGTDPPVLPTVPGGGSVSTASGVDDH